MDGCVKRMQHCTKMTWWVKKADVDVSGDVSGEKIGRVKKMMQHYKRVQLDR
jgi:hypothetical protein